jgi:hypothetical protein
MDFSRIFYILGNEDQRFINVFLENLLYQKKIKKQSPLLVFFKEDCFTTESMKMDRENKIKFFQYHTDRKISSISFERLQQCLSNKNSGETLFEEEKYISDIFIKNDLNSALMKEVDYFVVCLKKETGASSYLFNLFKELQDNGITKPVNIIVFDDNSIENSIDFFVKIKKEIKSLLNPQNEISYTGFVSFDEEKLVYSMDKNETLIKSFFESSFHGQIKFIETKLDGLEKTSKETSLFKIISDKK